MSTSGTENHNTVKLVVADVSSMPENHILDEVFSGISNEISRPEDHLVLASRKDAHTFNNYAVMLVDLVLQDVLAHFGNISFRKGNKSEVCISTECDAKILDSYAKGSGYKQCGSYYELYPKLDRGLAAQLKAEQEIDILSEYLVNSSLSQAIQNLQKGCQFTYRCDGHNEIENSDDDIDRLATLLVKNALRKASLQIQNDLNCLCKYVLRQNPKKLNRLCTCRKCRQTQHLDVENYDVNGANKRITSGDRRRSVDIHVNDDISSTGEIDLSDTFIITVFERQAKLEREAQAKAKIWQNNKRYSKKTRKDRRLQKKMKGLIPEETRPSYAEMGFWTEADLAASMDNSLLCPICMELLYSPYCCLPCEHVFCEYCLRRLSKYFTDKRMQHVCPVCRGDILRCDPQDGIKTQLLTSYPFVYDERRRTERQNKYKSFPLPAKQTSIRKQDVLSAAMNRQRQNHQRCNFITTILKLFLCVCVSVSCLGTCFIIFNILEHEHWLINWYLNFFKDLWNYGNLSAEEQVMVTNQAVVMLIMVGILSGVPHMMLK